MGKIKDLRSFLEVLKENDQLYIINKEVDKKHEIGSIIATLEKKRDRAAYFTKVKGSSIPVVGGLLANHKRIALALDTDLDNILEKLDSALNSPIKPVIIENPPFKENILTGDDLDLRKLPIPIHAPEDAGSFITAGVTVSKDFDSERQNLSFQRMQIKGRDKTGITINEWRHLKGFLNKAEAVNQPLPVTVAIGVDPVIMIAAGLRYDGNEMEVASGLRGRPIEVAKAHTCDINVPAYAEFIIEGEILPGIREAEGPMAEFSGHYGTEWQSPVFKVKAICHRNNPIWQTLNGSSFEHINLGNVLPREPLLKRFTTYASDSVTAVHLPPYGSGFLAIIAIEKKNPGEPKNIALAAMTSHVNIKYVIVVDTDVDIHNPAEVMWAVSNRVDPKNDIFYIPNAQGHEMDPASDRRGVQTKMGIDATLWDEKKDFKKVVYPEVNLAEYLK